MDGDSLTKLTKLNWSKLYVRNKTKNSKLIVEKI